MSAWGVRLPTAITAATAAAAVLALLVIAVDPAFPDHDIVTPGPPYAVKVEPWCAHSIRVRVRPPVRKLWSTSP